MIKELGKEIDKLKDRINSSETSKFKNTTNLSEISRAKEIRYAKEDPSEQEMKAFYEEILKVLS